MNPRCEKDSRRYTTVNGKPRSMQCRKRGITIIPVRTFFGKQVSGTGDVDVYCTRNEWRCADHASEGNEKTKGQKQ